MSTGQVLEMELQGRSDWPGLAHQQSSQLSPLLCPDTVPLATVDLHWGWEGWSPDWEDWSPDWEGWSPDLHMKLEQLSKADQGGAAPLPPVFAGHQF